jgi:hypothetical protein
VDEGNEKGRRQQEEGEEAENNQKGSPKGTGNKKGKH